MGNYSPREAVPAPEDLATRLSEIGTQVTALYALNGQCGTRFRSARDAINHALEEGVVSSSEYDVLIDLNRVANDAKHAEVYPAGLSPGTLGTHTEERFFALASGPPDSPMWSEMRALVERYQGTLTPMGSVLVDPSRRATQSDRQSESPSGIGIVARNQPLPAPWGPGGDGPPDDSSRCGVELPVAAPRDDQNELASSSAVLERVLPPDVDAEWHPGPRDRCQCCHQLAVMFPTVCVLCLRRICFGCLGETPHWVGVYAEARQWIRRCCHCSEVPCPAGPLVTDRLAAWVPSASSARGSSTLPQARASGSGELTALRQIRHVEEF